MSLIENVFDKLRRAGAQPPPPLSRTGAQVLSVLEQPAEPEFPHRQITIDLEDVRAAGYLPEKDNERLMADYYRHIKRPLIENALASAETPNMRLMLVTSPLPGDGKTFTSINLALSMARERDTSVLLIDADLPKAHISRAFGVQGERGLVDALLDETVDIESLILRTNVRGLDLLPAGKWTEGVTELITSSRMTELTSRLAARNPRRLVLMDSSPILVSIEARALIQIPGQVVVVVRSGKTPRQAVMDAISHVDKNKLQGFILNDARAATGNGYYNYSYYGYGSAEDGTQRNR